MKKLTAVLCLAVLSGLALKSPAAYAHHGYAAYDLTGTTTLIGTVTELSLANPHSSVAMDVKDASGTVNHWAVEFGVLRGLRKEGWTKDTLKPGDQIKCEVHVAKNGSHVGALVGRITYADGRALTLTPSNE